MVYGVLASMFAALAEPTRSGEDFEALAREHATAGGLNEQFRAWLEQRGMFDDVAEGLGLILDRIAR
jgi:pyrroline-5-carboxylate reductase